MQSKNLRTIKIHGIKVIKVRSLPVEQWQQEVNLTTTEDFYNEKILRLKDIRWRLDNRENFKKFLIMLLIWQNIAVFALVTFAVVTNKIAGLQTVFATLVGGTLLETTSMIFIIIKWLFSEIPYEKTKTKSQV